MAVLTINGTAIADPTGYNVSINDITKAERNAKGNLIAEKITTKRKISITYDFITPDYYEEILNLVGVDFFFELTYPDPKENGNKAGTFYISDRPSDGILYKDGKISVWKNVRFSLIEQ